MDAELAIGREPSDAELIATVRAGDQAAYGVLWNRHNEAARKLAGHLRTPADADELVSEAFYRVLRAITAGGGPDVAFRGYLLSTIRRLDLDTRKSAYGRVRLTNDHAALDVRVAAGADDVVQEREDHGAAARAWASMPESGRALLWHLVIEGDSVSTVARLLGTTPNGVSSRAVRAKEKLRQLFLQQHVRDATDEECRWARSQLGGHARNALPATTKAEVDAHLQHCVKGCPEALTDLQDVDRSLRAIIAPLILGAGAASKYTGGVSGLRSRARPRLRSGQIGLIATAAAAAIAVAGLILGMELVKDSPTRRALGPASHKQDPPAPPVTLATTPNRPLPQITPAPTPPAPIPPAATEPGPSPATGTRTPRSAPPTRTSTPTPPGPASPTPTPKPSRATTPTSSPSPSTTAAPSTSPSTSPSASPTPSTGTLTRSIAFELITPTAAGDGILILSAPTGWQITNLTAPPEAICTLNQQTAICTVINPAAGEHPFTATLTGPTTDTTTRFLHVSYTDALSTTSADLPI